MKTSIISLVILLSLLSPLVLNFKYVLGQEEVPPEPPTNVLGCLPTDPLGVCLLKLAKLVLRIIMFIALGLAAIFIAWGGILFITKGSDEKARQSAQQKIIYAAVGLVVAFIAWAISLIVARFAKTGEV